MHWFYKKGSRNGLCDVPGTRVGHLTLEDSGRGIHTGITAILPLGDNPCRDKFTATAHRINGFGKPLDLDQVQELGGIEFPILLTDTPSIRDAYRGLLDYIVDLDQSIGRPATINPLVLECSDGNINSIRLMALESGYTLEAIRSAREDLDQGSLGVGTGMACYGLKGGTGFTSRVLEAQGKTYALGALALANFSSTQDLYILGQRLGPDLVQEETEDQGSIVTILATNLPLNSHQLLRLCKRAQPGIVRTGSLSGHGNGESALASDTCLNPSIQDPDLNPISRVTVEVVEGSILKSLYLNQSKKAYSGKVFQSLKGRVRDHGVALPDLTAD